MQTIRSSAEHVIHFALADVENLMLMIRATATLVEA